MTAINKTRVTFDFDGERRASYEKLTQIICSSHWSSGIDIYGLVNESHSLIADFVRLGVIVIDQCEYEFAEPPGGSENAGLIKSMLGKRSSHPVLRDMAALFNDEPFVKAEHYRNTVYFTNLKAYARADGMKPEDIAEMFVSDSCEKIILFPYFPLADKPAYYELTLGIEKENFINIMHQVEEQRQNEMSEAIMRANERNKAGYRSILRLEQKSDRDIVERITYRAFLNAEQASGNEALLVHKLRHCAAFVPELNYVAELNGSVIGNIMYTRSKVVGGGGEWETLTFGPVSVLPKYQRDGVGSALIRKTLDIARELGYRAVLIFGHESYYPRFGFKPASEFGITTADGENFPAFMALPLYSGALDGVCGRLLCDDVYFTLDHEESAKLNAKLAAPMDVNEYIDAQPLYCQQFLRRVRHTIYTALPNAVEKIAYQMPTFWHDGGKIIHFAAFKRHIGVYPGAEAMAHFRPRLYRYKTSKGAIQFPYQDLGDEQLALIAEIAMWRAGENAK